MSSDSESDCDDTVPLEILEAAKNVSLNLLPGASRRKYTKVYNEFKKWRVSKKTKSFSEDVLLVYFTKLAENLASITLWSRFSMLKTTIKAYDNIDISRYNKLIAYIKKKNVGHKSKKSRVFTSTDISYFCNTAPDDQFLISKVALIIGISGACRREELTAMTVKDIDDHDTFLFIRVPVTKTKIERSFTVVGEFYGICKTYMEKRPDDTKTDRFFLCYRNGKCNRQPIGVNTFGSMPKQIATFLKLPDPELYTGHSFRRTSATLLVDAGADITTLKRHGGWKSNTVAEGYIENSLTNKKKIGQQIISSITANSASVLNRLHSSHHKNFDPSASTSSAGTESVKPKRSKTHDDNFDQNPSTSTAQTEPAAPVPISEESSDENIHQSSINSIADNASKINLSSTLDFGRNVPINFNNCTVTINMYQKND